MRTSPLGMRRRHRRAPLALLIVLLVALGAACSDDGGDEGTTPTTTSPSTTEDDGGGDTGDDATTTEPPADETTTSEATDDPAGGGPDDPGATGDTLDQAQVETELRRLYDEYVAAFVAARERGGLDERFRSEMAQIFFPELLQTELDGIEGIGGLAAVVPEPAAVPISEVQLELSQPGCASGSAVFDLSTLVGDAVPGPLTRYFKIEQSDAQPGWRFAALGSTESGETFAGASCEDP